MGVQDSARALFFFLFTYFILIYFIIFLYIIITYIKTFCFSLFHKNILFCLNGKEKREKPSLQKHFFFSTSLDYFRLLRPSLRLWGIGDFFFFFFFFFLIWV